MTTLAGRKIRRFREGHTPKLSRQSFGRRFGVPFSTVQGWEEDGKIPKPVTLARLVASGVVALDDWTVPADCPRCGGEADATDACAASDCPMMAKRRAA